MRESTEELLVDDDVLFVSFVAVVVVFWVVSLGIYWIKIKKN